jgi:WD40 repeat protein
VFWGDEETLFAPGPTAGSAVLQQITGDVARVLWTPESADHGQPSVSADGHRAALSRYDSVNTVVVIERKGAEVKTVSSFYPRNVFNYLRLSPSGDVVAVVTRSGSDLELHDVAANKELVRLDTRGIVRFNDIVWLEGGKTIVGLVTSQKPRNVEGSVEELISWDARTGKRLQVVTNGTLSSVGSASMEGKRFAEAGSDRNVRIRDAATLQVLMEFRAHNGPISALAWHPRRPVLATASEDLSVRLWNLETGQRLEELQGSLAPPNVLSFSPGGFRLATAARDGVARIWEPLCLQPAP